VKEVPSLIDLLRKPVTSLSVLSPPLSGNPANREFAKDRVQSIAGPGGPGGPVDWDDVENKPTTFPPQGHAASHAHGGGDDVTPSAIGAPSAPADTTEGSVPVWGADDGVLLDGMPVVQILADPGSHDNLATEAAIRAAISGTSPLTFPPDNLPNLIDNSSFEGSREQWYNGGYYNMYASAYSDNIFYYGACKGRPNSPRHVGVLMSYTPSSYGNVGLDIYSIPVESEEVYRISFWYRLVGTCVFYVRDASWNIIQTETLPAADNWTRYSFLVTNTNSNYTFHLQFYGDAVAETLLAVDDIAMYHTSVDYDYKPSVNDEGSVIFSNQLGDFRAVWAPSLDYVVIQPGRAKLGTIYAESSQPVSISLYSDMSTYIYIDAYGNVTYDSSTPDPATTVLLYRFYRDTTYSITYLPQEYRSFLSLGGGGGGPVAWGDITDKPSVFPPDAHNTAWGDITDKPSVFPPDAHHTAHELGGSDEVLLKLNHAISSDHTYSGITIQATAGQNLVFGDVCYLKAADSKYWKAQANATTTMNVRVMAVASISANATGTFLVLGYAKDASLTLTVGAPIWVSPSTPGLITVTQPSATTQQVQALGYGVSTSVFFFNPDNTWLEVL
jgi:hypothetical protein